jgi:hypothetical protein
MFYLTDAPKQNLQYHVVLEAGISCTTAVQQPMTTRRNKKAFRRIRNIKEKIRAIRRKAEVLAY